jgi:hypothetical protein
MTRHQSGELPSDYEEEDSENSENSEPRIRRKRDYFDADDLDPEMKKCYTLLHQIISNKSSWAFRQPVDPVALGVPDYLEIIKNPMDLSTVDSKIRAGKYSTSQDFANDMKLIWSNAMTFNQNGDEYYLAAEKLGNFFEKKMAAILKEKKVSPNSPPKSKPFIPTVGSSNKRGKKKIQNTDVSFFFQLEKI